MRLSSPAAIEIIRPVGLRATSWSATTRASQ
jgi:hypothetical protein